MTQPFTGSFSDGLRAMTGHCLAAIQLIRGGKWSLDDMEQWLTACQTVDSEYLKQQIKAMGKAR